ncbi:MAG: histidinol-phosphate transaminase [Acidimicrobiales bacterium]
MTLPSARADLGLRKGYHSAQVDADVRLNTNESPYPPPTAFVEDLAAEMQRIDFHRYPDRSAWALRSELAAWHGVAPEQVFCANGSNEVLQLLCLAYGGPGRVALAFEPTYALHSHIAHLTGTEAVEVDRRGDFTIDPAAAADACAARSPAVTFLCSPNNPTGMSEDPSLVRHLLSVAPGLVVVDEAYGQFADWSALDLVEEGAPLVVIRTFSKTWSMAGVRLGYLVAASEVVEVMGRVALPYHLDSVKQVAGRLALRHVADMEIRVATIVRERQRLFAALASWGPEVVTTWPSQANFILWRPETVPGPEVWRGLVERGVLVRDTSSWPGLAGCLRVTVGTPVENDRFLGALKEVLG